MGDLAASTSWLQTLMVDDDTIKQIVTILNDEADRVSGNHPGSLNSAYLGGSETGQNLGHHTSLAHQKVIEALEDLVTGLTGFRENVEAHHRNVKFQDEGSAAGSHRGSSSITPPSIDSSAGCTTQPDVRTNPTCGPTGGA